MRKILTLLLLFFLCSCNKEEMTKNAVINAMTSGQWRVASFKDDATDITTDFAPYKFQFKENLTVDAINNAAVEKTGTWTADANTKTITSTFDNVNAPLILLNGTWKITDNSWAFVEATQTVNGKLRNLRLEK